MSCNCNNPLTCGCGNQSTLQVCGQFDTQTDTPDLGQCAPYRSKRDCGAPVVTRAQCPGENPSSIPHPGEIPPFRILTQLFDENCLPILDENNLNILTLI